MPNLDLPAARSTLSFGLLLTALFLVAAAVLAFSVCIGSVALAPGRIWAALTGSEVDTLARTLVMELRLPRALGAFAVGGLLALAGILMQVLLRNPLADPFVMGVSGGASVAALGALLLGYGSLIVSAAAAGGAFATMLLVFALAHGPGGWTSTRLLLTGVVVAAGASAVIGLLLTLGSDSELRGMVFWLMGDLAVGKPPAPLLMLLAIAVLAVLISARHLNVLARGELQALILGMPVSLSRILVFAVSSVLTAGTVTYAGTVGFVGLVTPHLARLLVGADHRRIVPTAVLLGGSLVSLADLVARTAFAPRQLPVGALTALVGVPLFLLLMGRQRTVS